MKKVWSVLVAAGLLWGSGGGAHALAEKPAAVEMIHQVELPDGTVMKPTIPEPVKWKDLVVSLGYVKFFQEKPNLQMVVGNHARILSTERLDMPGGPTWLAYVERTPPAAAPKTEKTKYEYWLVRYCTGKEGALAMTIRAQVKGKGEKAKIEMWELARYWKTKC